MTSEDQICMFWRRAECRTFLASNGQLQDHSRSQSPRFFWSRGQRNEGLW